MSIERLLARELTCWLVVSSHLKNTSQIGSFQQKKGLDKVFFDKSAQSQHTMRLGIYIFVDFSVAMVGDNIINWKTI